LLEHSNNQWTEKKVLLDKIPSDTYHHGGRLKIGPDNKLYATTGDATNPDLSQDTSALNGKILRLNLDGSIPDDNPYQDSYVFTYGHRNAQGMVWDDEGIMYASEHGDQANDEINRIEGKMNYGWPEIEGSDQQEGMESPLYTSGKGKTWAPAGIALNVK